jgi:hypothetical protein
MNSHIPKTTKPTSPKDVCVFYNPIWNLDHSCNINVQRYFYACSGNPESIKKIPLEIVLTEHSRISMCQFHYTKDFVNVEVWKPIEYWAHE